MQKAIDILNRTIKNSFDIEEIESCAIAIKILIDRMKHKGLFSLSFIDVVCVNYSVNINDLKGKSRKRKIVLPRQIISWYLRYSSDYSLNGIGNIFNQNHATILNSKTNIDNRIDTDKLFRNELELRLNEVGLSIYKVRGY